MIAGIRGRRRRRDEELEVNEDKPGTEAEGRPLPEDEQEDELEISVYTKRRQSPEEEERLEKEHFWKIINAFSWYRTHIYERVTRSEKQFRSLPKYQQKLLPHFFSNMDRLRKCADQNQEILQMIVNDCTRMFENKEYDSNSHRKLSPASSFDMDKLKSTIKQFVRDWSEEGKTERDACYQPIIDEILRSFPQEQCDVSQINVLVPGAGLGRLAWEIAKHGYACQGNEWSFFMLFSSHFVLNRCSHVNAFKLYPWIHQFSNNVRSADQVRPVYFPDVNPHDLPTNSNFSMTAGDFQEIYTDNADTWDCIATCFFLDTAHNVMDYIETIWKILKPGGLWINLGPLLYHYENMANELSIELSYEDIKNVILQHGFTVEVSNFFEVTLHLNCTFMHEKKCSRSDFVFFLHCFPDAVMATTEGEDISPTKPYTYLLLSLSPIFTTSL